MFWRICRRVHVFHQFRQWNRTNTMAASTQLQGAGKDIWFARTLFPIGKPTDNEPRFRQRVLEAYQTQPHVLEEEGNESSKEQLEEERQMIQAIERGEEVEMLLDVTMTVIRLPGHQLLLHRYAAAVRKRISQN
eukprot:gb/GECG01003235.1/.p1 GENE.gb/GECG01003235.1/~~gb/GECG01003235.1/.p1  ORF type:complete len:134 (+),score=22.72 gb/GECG01003235.1/:1-402(+)